MAALTLKNADMAKVKKKLTPVQKRVKKVAKEERKRKYQWVFMNGKQVRIKRSPTVDGMTVEQFVEENADLIFLHQNELWELMPVEDALSGSEPSRNYKGSHPKEQPAAVAGRVSAALSDG
ncbi:hypothetical protein [Photobacterium halotolerans]|uniref:hypothetical protein n=1 Tax=Photobacterium halotolerans TaxID=265726 RepID=UPI001929FE6F|nr:hypothetical protein [Photobacterium halotolerans]